MPENDQKRQKRSMITVGLTDVADDSVIKIKKGIEQLLIAYPDAVVDLRMGSSPGAFRPSSPQS